MNHEGHEDHKEAPLETSSRKVIGCAIEVHKALGPGLLESTYQRCLEIELEAAGVAFSAQAPIDILFKNHTIQDAYRVDLLVENELIVELKSVRELEPIHEAQLLTYLKLSGIRTGILINFNKPTLKEGIKRLAS